MMGRQLMDGFKPPDPRLGNHPIGRGTRRSIRCVRGAGTQGGAGLAPSRPRAAIDPRSPEPAAVGA